MLGLLLIPKIDEDIHYTMNIDKFHSSKFNHKYSPHYCKTKNCYNNFEWTKRVAKELFKRE